MKSNLQAAAAEIKKNFIEIIILIGEKMKLDKFVIWLDQQFKRHFKK